MTMSPELARQFAKVVQQFDGVFPILQRIYKKAGNDKKVNRAMGKELDRMGGLSMMQVRADSSQPSCNQGIHCSP